MKEYNQNFVKIICKEQSKVFEMDKHSRFVGNDYLNCLYNRTALWCMIKCVKRILNFSTRLRCRRIMDLDM